MKKLDLGFGNPTFIQELLESSYEGSIGSNNADYSNTTISDSLKEAIYELHEVIGNVSNPRSYRIVIGNGASQLLTAVSSVMPIGFYAPFWSRFNYLVKDNVLFTKEWPHYGHAANLMVTYPNNPDGELSPKVLEAPVVDASYNWPIYYRHGEKMRALDNDVLIFSFSKLSGLSSVRLGWALVKQEETADLIQHEVEMTTCGVSPLAQQVAEQVMDEIVLYTKIPTSPKSDLVSVAQQVLNDRWLVLDKLVNNSKSYRGMFLYLLDRGRKVEEAGIKGFRGKAFGDSDDYIRLNIGCSEQDFQQLVNILSELNL